MVETGAGVGALGLLPAGGDRLSGMRRRTAPLVLLPALALIVSGCSGMSDHEYTVQDDPSIWLASGYSEGIGEQFEFDGEFCGAADGIIVWSDMTDGKLTVRALDTDDNTETWTIDNADCGTGIEGSVAVAVLEDDESQLERVDIVSGERTALVSAGVDVLYPSLAGQTSTGLIIQYIQAGRGVVSHVVDGTSEWTTELSTKHSCTLLGEYVGCASESEFDLLSAETGSEAVSGQLSDPRKWPG